MRPTGAPRAHLRHVRAGLVALLLVAGCGSPAPRHYYTLTGQAPATRFAQPYPIKLRVRDLEMRRSYRRDELVVRADAHEMTFLRRQRWSEPPQRMISGLVREQVARSGISVEVQDESGIGEPDYVLSGEIEAIEQLTAGRDRFAHLAMTYRLRRFKDDATVWTYRIDARRPVSASSMRSMVRSLSEILAVETDRALADMGRFFADPTSPRAVAARPVAPPKPPAPGMLIPDDDSPLNNLPQLLRDDTAMPVGKGAIFAPSLAGGDREPLVTVNRNGRLITGKAKLGKRIIVDPGDYQIRVGSGAGNQQLTRKVRVAAGKTTVVPPGWAGLDVAVVDESFVPFRGTYELIRMESREDFGLGFGVDEQLGEVTRVWVLPPGLYKIIRSGGTYRDRTDFATVRLEAGRLTRFTLVVDRDDGSFLGAGENDPDTDLAIDVGDAQSSADQRRWLFRAVVGGDLNLRRTDEIGEQEGWRVSFRAFFDGSARLLAGRHLWHTQLELEEGQTRLPDQDTFQSDADRLFFHTIYTYELLSWFGPYARAGLETKLLPRYENFDTPEDVIVVDEDGMPVRTLDDVRRVKLGSTFAPLSLKEGAGGNFRLLRTRFAELDLRLGFGGRQTIANELYVFEEDLTGGPGRLIPVVDSSVEGLEGTLVGLGRITRFITVSTELDGLVPVKGEDLVVVTSRNQVNVRLASFLSLNYRFNLTRDPNLGIGTDVRTEHDVQLRFSFVVF
ncbi:MAG TPA: ABC-type transport auxiliary lipoprotein family protein [Kofleriaceae bacterium]|nr:ABC-type transport auxiliary lipoprotein family protein [Kofleriaceae bacterium]